jgi:hypothetical protein
MWTTFVPISNVWYRGVKTLLWLIDF